MAEKEYIERGALIAEMESEAPENWTNSDTEIQEEWDYLRYRDMILAQPTADVVEVIRCKDCKYFIPDAELDHNEYPNIIEADGLCDCSLKFTDADDFCSHGKRRDQK